MEDSSFCVLGFHRRAPVAVFAIPTLKGWKTRSTRPDVYNHDYSKTCTEMDVMDWLETSLRVDAVTHDAAETVEGLVRFFQEEGSIGMFHMSAESSMREKAERVLRHVGWKEEDEP